MKTVSYSDGRRLYPLKVNRYKLVSSLISHIRVAMNEANKVDPLSPRALNPDYHDIVENPIKQAVEDYLDGKVELAEAK